MKAKITNTSKALQGVHTVDGLRFIEPGKSETLDVADDYVARVNKLPFLDAEWHGKAPAKTVTLTDEVKSAADVLAMFGDKSIPFMSARAEAAKLLGDAMPAKKPDIIAALEDLATRPE